MSALHEETACVHFQARGVNLSCVRSCVVIAEERPRLALSHSFSKLFKDVGLSPRAVSTAFGSRVNLAVCLQVRLTVRAHPHTAAQHKVKTLNLNMCFVFFPGNYWSRPLYSVCGHEVSSSRQVLIHGFTQIKPMVLLMLVWLVWKSVGINHFRTVYINFNIHIEKYKNIKYWMRPIAER